MSVISEEVVPTNSASKFEALLYQFVKLYDRLTLEHSLMNDRELKLIKDLEGFNQTMQELKNVITTTNNALIKIDELDVKLSAVMQDNIIEPLVKACASLNNVGSQVTAIIKASNQQTAELIWSKLSVLIEENVKQQLGDNLDFYNKILRDTTTEFKEFAKKMEELYVKDAYLLNSVIFCVGIIVGVILRRYMF